jgi:hypothetical protein
MIRSTSIQALARLALLLLIVLATACGRGGGSSGDEEGFANLKAFISGSRFAGAIVECAKIEYVHESCTFTRLPLIGQSAGTPDVAAIMDRVAVSHDWMGHRFREALVQLPPDIRLLLRSVTAIIIDDDLNPSFYLPASGAIYLDPYYLWQTNSEKATISQEPDYRSGFGDELRFLAFSRYVVNDDWAWVNYSLSGPEERNLDDLLKPLAALLYHELAHANDYFPQGAIAGLDLTRSAYQSAINPGYVRASAQLDSALPLTSSILEGIARVRFHGDIATPQQKVLTALQASGDFNVDGANDDYNYSSTREDVAMLFEETMLHHHYGLERDIAFMPTPLNPERCENYIVAWGSRSRLGLSHVKARASFVSTLILPNQNLDSFYLGLPAPEALSAGANWCDSVVLPASPGVARAKSTRVDSENRAEWSANTRGYE